VNHAPACGWPCYFFIDWIITLPVYLEEKITDEIIRLEEAEKMTYITNAERIGEKRGEKKEKIRIAEKLLAKKFSVKDVVEITGLSEQ
jgi:hypothetical protein